MTEPVTPSRAESPRREVDQPDCRGGNCHGGPGHGHAHDHGRWGGERVEVAFAAVAALCLVAGWVASRHFGDPGLVATRIFLTLAYFTGGYFALVEAIEGLRARRFQIDFLMVLAALGAAFIGHPDEGALLLVLFAIGHAAEHYALGRARRSIEALAELRPKTAMVIDDASGEGREVEIEALRIGDTVLVRPDSRIAADGVVVEGESSVDQSAVTGESVPVEKSAVVGFDPVRQDWQSLPAEHKLYAGTINGSGGMRLRVTRTAEDMTLSRVMRLVTEAKTKRSPTQRLTDAVQRRFVPLVLILVALLPLVCLVTGEPFSASLYRAIAVLVAASPCALAIATPSAVLSAVARGGRDGVLFKGGGPLEQLGRVEAIALDKTGTLTVGKPEVVDVIPAPGVDRSELLEVAAKAETLSDHPLAGAIVRAARQQRGLVAGGLSNEPRPEGIDPENGSPRSEEAAIGRVERFTGKGIRVALAGGTVWVGSSRWFSEIGADAGESSGDRPVGGRRPVGESSLSPPRLPDWVIEADDRLKRDGRTTMVVCRADRYLGVIGLADSPRPTAADLSASLRAIGIRKLVILSGDHQAAAESVGREVGIGEVFGELSPEDKLRKVQSIAAQMPVAMIGDGVNDAPALAAATVSIAMGAAGSDVALETADVALMGDDLSRLPLAVALSRQASRVIRQNLWISLGTIAVLVPAALLGLKLAAAVIFHEGSTVLVVLNALRLLGFTHPTGVQRMGVQRNGGHPIDDMGVQDDASRRRNIS